MMKLRKLDFVILTYLLKIKIWNICISLKRLELAQKCLGNICRFLHLPSNGAIAINALCELDLRIDGKNILKFLSLKRC